MGHAEREDGRRKAVTAVLPLCLVGQGCLDQAEFFWFVFFRLCARGRTEVQSAAGVD